MNTTANSMTGDLSAARIYTNLQGLNDLRLAARKDTDATLEEVAAQFEAMFIQMMLKSMRDASLADGIFDSDQSRMYTEMFDQQLALDLSQKQTFGIAEMLVRQLASEQPATAAGTVRPLSPPTSAKNTPAGKTPGAETVAFQTPAAFVESLMPEAKRAARTLGVEPGLLIAQAALETGWGQKIIQRADGSSSFNLFGIKAGANWQGDSVRVSTLEYRDGLVQREQASFRAYNSYRESFADYVDFISGNARYGAALEHDGDAEQYARALQDAGYATDPRYAEKIIDILQRSAG